MKKMTVLTKHLCALLVMCSLFVCAWTETAYAAFTSLTVGGVDALTTSSGSGWSYNASTSTLTISGDIGAVNATVPANSQDVLNITVTNNATVDGGIYAGGKLHLDVNTGVTLTVYSDDDVAAIKAGYTGGVTDSLTICGGGTVIATSSGNGIDGGSGLKISGVTVKAEGYNRGLTSNSGILEINNSKVYAVANQYAIHANSTNANGMVRITGDETVVVAGYTDVSDLAAPASNTGISGTVLISIAAI